MSASELLIQAINTEKEKTVSCAAHPTISSKVIQKSFILIAPGGLHEDRHVMRHFTNNGADQCQNGSSSLFTP